jgi:pseudaminic acid biosynthesis-associated methylase
LFARLEGLNLMNTPQIVEWVNQFGREYTDRNVLSESELDALYEKNYGINRRQLNQPFLSGIPADCRILEVGCNVGNQLTVLREMGYQELYGSEIQKYALEQARRKLPDVHFTEASAFEIPYPGNYFDVVFTSGVLIHIAPNDLPRAVDEIHRCAKQYVWGFEYYSPQAVEVQYRGNQGLLWKMDYAQFYLDRFADLSLVRREELPYLENSNVDSMFLLRKTI